MNQSEFLEVLSSVYSSYSWQYTNNRLTGTAKRGDVKGSVFNPVTAVAYKLSATYYPNTKRGTLQAARSLGMTTELATAVYSQSNRGHAQIVRGKMLNIVPV